MTSVGLRHLRSFATVADAGSITEASRVLYLAQPALSRQLAALERDIGQRLLDRTSRGAVLTDEGRRFLVGTRRILDAYDGLIGRGSDDRGAGQDGQAILRLGVEADAPPQIAENLRAYAAGPDSARWKIARAHEDDLRTMLLDGHVDAAVLWLPWQDPSIVMAAVTHITSFAVLPTDLAARYPGTVPGSFFGGQPFVIWERAEQPLAYDHWVGLMERVAGAPLETVTVWSHDNSQAAMLRAVADGKGVSIVSEPYWRAHSRPDVEVRDVDPPLLAPLYVAWREDGPTAWIADLLSAFQ